MDSLPVYVLVTSARNESGNILRTIESVASQDVLPARWVIVDDGSSDGTGAVVASLAARYPWITLLSRSPSGLRGFASKSAAIGCAVECLAQESYDVLGNLDADVAFGTTYYRSLLSELRARPALGITGGLVYEVTDRRLTPQRISNDSVAGAVQTFRKECFVAVGGYGRFELGGEDAAAEIIARMAGWEVETIRHLPVMHFGYQKNTRLGLLRKRWRWGRMFHTLGYHPLFEAARCAARIGETPVILGSVAELASFMCSSATRGSRLLPPETVRYLRSEQAARLRSILRRGR